MTIACIFYSRRYLSKKFYRLPDENGNIVEAEYQEPNYDAAFNMDMEGIPGTFASFAPLLLPIVLILINTANSSIYTDPGELAVRNKLAQQLRFCIIVVSAAPLLIAYEHEISSEDGSFLVRYRDAALAAKRLVK